MVSMSIEREFFFTYAAVKNLNYNFSALKDLTVSLSALGICERERNGQLPFLDVLISFVNNGFSTSVYRKNTFKGLLNNYMNFTPFRQINL